MFYYVSANPEFISSLRVISVGAVLPTTRELIRTDDMPDDDYAYRCTVTPEGIPAVRKAILRDGRQFREIALIK